MSAAQLSSALPVAGSSGSYGITSSYAGSGNVQHYKNVYAAGFQYCYDIEGEHFVADTVTSAYCINAGEIGRAGENLYHPVVMEHVVDQENQNGWILGPNIQAGQRTDMFGLDIEILGSGPFARVNNLVEVNSGVSNGIITYASVEASVGEVPIFPFSSGGGNFIVANGNGFGVNGLPFGSHPFADYSPCTLADPIPTVGRHAIISDSTVDAVGAVISGGGSFVVEGICLPPNWIVEGGVGGGNGTVTSVASGTGLNGGPITGSGTLNIAASYQLPQGCLNGQVPAWNSTSSTWSTCSSASGTPGGSNGQFQINSSSAFGGVTISGDLTINSSGVGTVSKTGGVAFGPLATVTNAIGTSAGDVIALNSNGDLPGNLLPAISAYNQTGTTDCDKWSSAATESIVGGVGQDVQLDFPYQDLQCETNPIPSNFAGNITMNQGHTVHMYNGASIVLPSKTLIQGSGSGSPGTGVFTVQACNNDLHPYCGSNGVTAVTQAYDTPNIAFISASTSASTEGFGSELHHLTSDCNGVAGCTAVANLYCQENCGGDDLDLRGWDNNGRGLWEGTSTGQGSGGNSTWTQLNLTNSVAGSQRICQEGATGIFIDEAAGGPKKIDSITIGNTYCNTLNTSGAGGGTGTVNSTTASSGSCPANCVTWVSGATFNTNWLTGNGFTINGSPYLIQTVYSSTLLSVQSAPGTHTGVAYTANGQASWPEYNMNIVALGISVGGQVHGETYEVANVLIGGKTTGYGAYYTAAVSSGTMTLTQVNGGAAYSSTPLVHIYPSYCTGGTLTPTVAGGVITGISSSGTWSNCPSTPFVSIVDSVTNGVANAVSLQGVNACCVNAQYIPTASVWGVANGANSDNSLKITNSWCGSPNAPKNLGSDASHSPISCAAANNSENEYGTDSNGNVIADSSGVNVANNNGGLNIATQAGSSNSPFCATYQGALNGVCMAAGTLSAIGSGSINATKVPLSGITGTPTTPNGVPQVPTCTPSSGACNYANSLPGISGRSVTGTTDTILSTDCSPARVAYTGSAAVAVALPTPTTLGVPSCTLKLANNTTATVTITPATWTISAGSGGAAGSSLALLEGQEAVLFVDSKTSNNWAADVVEQSVTGSGVSRSASGITVSGGGSSAFSAITGGTNSSAAMVVGSGASLSASGSGSITATAMAYNLLTNGSAAFSITQNFTDVITYGAGTYSTAQPEVERVVDNNGIASTGIYWPAIYDGPATSTTFNGPVREVSDCGPENTNEVGTGLVDITGCNGTLLETWGIQADSGSPLIEVQANYGGGTVSVGATGSLGHVIATDTGTLASHAAIPVSAGLTSTNTSAEIVAATAFRPTGETASITVTAAQFAAYTTFYYTGQTANVTVTLPASTALPSIAGQYIVVSNQSTSFSVAVAIGSGTTINGGSGSIALSTSPSALATRSAFIWFDGTNYQAITAGLAQTNIPLTALASQAQDTVVMNASGSSTSPTAVAMPTTGTNGCAGTSNALTYNTSTHALGCNSISGSGLPSCADTSGSGTAQSCTLSGSATLTTNSCFSYTTTTANTGGLTLAVNGGSAAAVQKWLGAALVSGDMPANKSEAVCWDGTHFNVPTIGNAPSGSGNISGTITTTGNLVWTDGTGTIQDAGFAGYPFAFTSGGNVSASATTYVGVGQECTTNSACQIPVPRNGTVGNLFCHYGSALSGSETLVITAQHAVSGTNGATSLTCTLNSTNTTSCSDTTSGHAFTVATSTSDTIQLQTVPSGTPPTSALNCTVIYQ
jgi:hypothetical protein